MNLDKFLETRSKLMESLKVSVKIDHEEVTKIVVRDLIEKRNSDTNKIRTEFDAVLRYYIDEEEFDKYVLRGKKIK